jgi:hypothetical protein
MIYFKDEVIDGPDVDADPRCRKRGTLIKSKAIDT